MYDYGRVDEALSASENALVAVDGVNDVVEHAAHCVSFLGKRVKPRLNFVLLVICSLNQGCSIDSFWMQ